ncbi:hypothetical protein [Rhizobium sp. AAP43]|uniref:hypothetical protein n=1 Tax=Rhizobium sp. AAP43 TaxID=1523420 RepID=UPI000AA5392A|nr:hypothetical protein [Rhizobium sp. AAP43]
MTDTDDMTAEPASETPAPVKTPKVSPQERAAATDAIARETIESEAKARIRKTEALKALRLERELLEAQDAPAPKKKRATKAKTA